MSRLPKEPLAKAIFVPSGEKAASASDGLSSVSLSRPVPSLLMIKRSRAPSRMEVKAIFVPSGEKVGISSILSCVVRLMGSVPPISIV